MEESEKADERCAESKYPDKISFVVTAGAGFEGNKIKGEKSMKMKCMKKLQSLFLSMMLIVAMALCVTGCNDKKNGAGNFDVAVEEDAAEQKDAAVSKESTPQEENEGQPEGNVLGKGAKQFDFVVVDKDGNRTEFEIHTDKETVGEALLDLGLIAGDTGDYGLYVKTVNGITVDYDTDGKYWAFYVNDEYATSGVDFTAIAEGEVYSFKVE